MALLPVRRGGTVVRPGSQAADLTEAGDAYVAEVDLPGVRKAETGRPRRIEVTGS